MEQIETLIVSNVDLKNWDIEDLVGFSIYKYFYDNVKYVDNVITDDDTAQNTKRKNGIAKMARAKGLMPILIKDSVIPDYSVELATNCMCCVVCIMLLLFANGVCFD